MFFCKVKHSSEVYQYMVRLTFLFFYIFYQKAITKISCLDSCGDSLFIKGLIILFQT